MTTRKKMPAKLGDSELDSIDWAMLHERRIELEEKAIQYPAQADLDELDFEDASKYQLGLTDEEDEELEVIEYYIQERFKGLH